MSSRTASALVTLPLIALLCALSAPEAGAAGRGTLDFTRVLAPSAPLWDEGSVSFLRLRTAGGAPVLERSAVNQPRFRVRVPLPAGRYRLTSFERPCQGNCLLLDPPAARCSRRVTVFAAGRTGVRATVRPGRGCRLAVRARPPLFPDAGRIRAAERFVASRTARVSFALIDSHGRLHAHRPGGVFVSASVVKAMLLVAYLRRIGNRMPDAGQRAVLGPMITSSDNGAASVIHAWVGDLALVDLARRAGMRSFNAVGYWSGASFNAADQARFFRAFEGLVPPRSRGYAGGLLSSIVSWQRWGFSRYSLARGFRTYFKGGWRGTSSGQLVHEAALFERPPLRVSMAVLSDGNPTFGYGTATLRGVAARIFGRRSAGAASAKESERALRRAGLVEVRSRAPGIGVELAYRTQNNLTGRRLPGYCADEAFLLRRAAGDLARVQRHLRRRGLGLLVLDAYRPARGSRALVRWARRSGRADLVGTYIAQRSRHNTGSAVDLTLVRAGDGGRLGMGTGFDDLSARAHTRNATGRVLRNRLVLKRAMERFGFQSYWREWWHFEHRSPGPAYLDLPIGCPR